MANKYDFKYTKSPTGSISGADVLTQTEDAINDLGRQTVENNDSTSQALEVAKQAKETADLGLSTAQNAKATADENAQSIININGTLTTLQTNITEGDAALSLRIDNLVTQGDGTLALAEKAVRFDAQTLTDPQKTQARANIDAAGLNSPAFTGIVTAESMTVTGDLNATASAAINDSLGRDISQYYAPLQSPEFWGDAIMENLSVTGTLTANLTGTADRATADAAGNVITATYATKADTYTKSEVDAKVSSVYRFKGSVASYANLPSSGQVVGDVWNVTDTGANYAWSGTEWDKLSETVDLTPYLTKADAANTYLNKSANAVSASKWATARTVTVAGDATGSVTLDGSQNVTLTIDVTQADSATKATQDGGGKVIASTYLPKSGGTMTGALILNANPTAALGAATKQYVDSAVTTGTRDAVLYTTQALSEAQKQQARTNIGAISAAEASAPDLTAYLTKADAQNTYLAKTATAAAANKLATARTISLTGGATGSANFDGSANVNLAVTVPEDATAASILQAFEDFATENGIT